MKITVLVDNNTYIDEYYLGEPGFSLYIEDENRKILFDTGYSDVFYKNACKMGIDLSQIDTIVFSHGHNDHTGGLRYIENFKNAIEIVCHSQTDEYKEYNGLIISSPVKFDSLPQNFKITKTDKPYQLTDNLWFLGQIPRTVQPLRKLGDDCLWDDSALLYKKDNKISVITGCSHSGICNIVEYSKNLAECDDIDTIIGGFHLLDNKTVTDEVCQYMSQQKIKRLYPCHCTDLKAKIALSKVMDIGEVGVGLQLEM